jgi:ABC-type protease/lipase transport system fused ATPase/permease subunit
MIAASILLGRALAPIDVGVSQWAVVQRARGSWRALTSCSPGGRRDPETELPVTRGGARRPLGDADLQAPGEQARARPGLLEIRPGRRSASSGAAVRARRRWRGSSPVSSRPPRARCAWDGATLSQYGPDRLGRYVGYLPQEVQFFDGTVAENIARMASGPDDAKVVEAAKKARVHDIILSLPDGYDTQVNGIGGGAVGRPEAAPRTGAGAL